MENLNLLGPSDIEPDTTEVSRVMGITWKKARRVESLRQAVIRILQARSCEQCQYIKRTEIDGLTISLRSPMFWWHSKSLLPVYFESLVSKESLKIRYGLDVWAPNKVLNLEWDDGGVAIISFRPGLWEKALLSVASKVLVKPTPDLLGLGGGVPISRSP
jgi:hypothetical protein